MKIAKIMNYSKFSIKEIMAKGKNKIKK